jgi:hypothetical protein
MEAMYYIGLRKPSIPTSLALSAAAFVAFGVGGYMIYLGKKKQKADRKNKGF